MKQVKSCLYSWIKDQKKLALELIRKDHFEDKLAGILYIQEILLPSGSIKWKKDLSSFEKLFKDKYIFDWSTCDWFCVKVLENSSTEMVV